MTRLKIGEEFDRYRIERVLGQGGAATVYAVRHLRLDSLQALKVMHLSTPSFRHRLLQEGRGQAGLRHPNVVSVFDVLEINDAPALLMEYVDGPTLGRLIKSRAFTVSEALWLFRGIVLGVGAAHRRGLVHRDLKPDNVLLAPTNDGLVPKVTDFGLVKMVGQEVSQSQIGRAIGTAPYMAPEQVRGAVDIDQRADLWALGCILYELVSGERTFHGSNPLDTFNRVQRGEFIPLHEHLPEAPPNLLRTVAGLLQLDREQRIASVDQLFEMLFDNAMRLTRVDLPSELAHEPAGPILGEDEPTVVTDIATPVVQQHRPHMPIAPLGPDLALENFRPVYTHSHTLSANHAPLPEPKLKKASWLPIATVLTALAAVAVICILLLSRGLEPQNAIAGISQATHLRVSPPSTTPAGDPP